MKSRFLIISISILFFACKEPEARRPVLQKTSNSYKEVVAKSKQINAEENQRITQLIALDSLHTYQASTYGFWYTYLHKTVENLPTPKTGDVVVLEYNIQDLQGNILYSKEALGLKNYTVDKEDFISALQDGIKLMKVGETITFVIPFYRAFGASGDGNKIGINQSIKSTLTLIEIKEN